MQFPSLQIETINKLFVKKFAANLVNIFAFEKQVYSHSEANSVKC